MSRGISTEPRDLADRLHSAAIHLLRRLRRSDPLTGVTPAQLSALSVLMGGPRTIGELATAEQVRPPTITRLVQGMERTGLARRETDPGDARLVRVRWTAKGERTLRRGRELRIADLKSRLRTLSRDELDDLSRAVSILDRVVRDEGPSLPSGARDRSRAKRDPRRR